VVKAASSGKVTRSRNLHRLAAIRLHGSSIHPWTEGSFRKTAGLGWIITEDNQGAGPVIDQGSKTLPGKQVAFDAEITVIEEALKWFQNSDFQHLVIHSDSVSAIARAGHSGAGSGQRPTKSICTILSALEREGRTAKIQLKDTLESQATNAPMC
jgi:hypothetical protein